MIIDRISILNFKNIAEAELSFSPKINCFFGNNGMGKTNLLDALYYLSFTKNYTNLSDSQLIQNDKDFCVLQGFYKETSIDSVGDNSNCEEIYCGIKRRQKKKFKRNKKEYDRLSDHIGLIPIVIISPEDTGLIQGGSEERRKFVDMLISQYDREYLQALIRYNKALRQRNSLLKEMAFSDDSLFELWEEQMAVTGTVIHEKRKAFIAEFLPVFIQYHQAISNGSEAVDLCYESKLQEFPLEQLLVEKRERDKILGYSSVGVHKDDFDFLLDKYLIRKIGSQGQNKTYLIALKLAQFSFLVQKGSSVPLLLLDDIFDKLDAQRVKHIVELVSGTSFGQIFITDTNRKYLDEILLEMRHEYKLFQVNQGEIAEMV